MIGPITRGVDSTFVFASPVGDGYVALISLRDIGFFAGYSFDHRQDVSGTDLEIASKMVAWDGPDGLVETSKHATRQKALHV
ncbi:hypothetical protein ACEPAH_6871 [Sanghuangporus vaninii]